MSAPPTPSTQQRGGNPQQLPYQHLTPAELEQWDGPMIALAQKSQGDLRKLFFHFFSFLHRRTDFYMLRPQAQEHMMSADGGGGRTMGFGEGDAERMLLAAFRQFPLRRMPSQQQKQQQTTRPAQQSKPAPAPVVSGAVTKAVSTSASNTAGFKKSDCTNDCDEESKKSPTKEEPKTERESIKAKKDNEKKNDTKSVSENNNKDSTSIQFTTNKNGHEVQIPQHGNGGKSLQHGFHWTQTIQEVSIAYPLPTSNNNTRIRAKDLKVVMKTHSISIGLKTNNSTTTTTTSSPILLEGQLTQRIRPDESTWTLEEDGVLLLTLEKNTPTWWNSILTTTSESNNNNNNDGTKTMTDADWKETIDTSLIESKRHIDEYDNATQTMIRKILFDQRQERLGLPGRSEDILAKEMEGKHERQHDNDIEKKERETLDLQKNLPPGVEYIDKSNFPPNRKG